MGTGWVRDENGIHMVTCDYCEGEGRAPARCVKPLATTRPLFMWAGEEAKLGEPRG